jgi:signal transduction histidine kinase
MNNESNIEAEECLGEIRKMISGNYPELEESKSLICKAQNLIQKWIEKNIPTSEWKHLKTKPELKNLAGSLTPQ